MDNNLISIDDLFRQRLGGKEEERNEQAWIHMKQLLEEKERKPLGFFFWRRAMSYTGAAILLASLVGGGYQVSQSLRGDKEGRSSNDDAHNATSTIVSANTTHTPTNSTENNQNTPATPNSVAHSNVLQHPTASASNAAASINKKVINQARHIQHQQLLNDIATTQELPKATTTNIKPIEFAPKDANMATANADMNEAPLASAASGPEHFASTHTATEQKYTTTKTANNTQAPVENSSNNKAPQATASSNGAITTDNNQNSSSQKTTPSNQPLATSDVSNSKATSNGHEATNDDKKALTPTIKHNSTPVAANAQKASAMHVPADAKDNGNMPSHNGDKQPKPLAASGNDQGSSVGNAKAQPNKIVPVDPLASKSKTAETRPSSQMTPIASTTPQQNQASKVIDQPLKELSASATHPNMVKKVRNNYSIKERIVGSGPHMKRVFDTIDVSSSDYYVEKKVEESENEPTTSDAVAKSEAASGGARAIAKDLKVTRKNGAKPTAGSKNTTAPTMGQDVAKNDVPAPKHNFDLTKLSAIAPQANNSVTELGLMHADMPKLSAIAKKKKGLHVMEALSNALNEVNIKLAGVQFAPGLNAGINATFFGPNSFRGFQFGFTGNFEMDDRWSMAAELKYFNRMNSNYTMYDNYFDYSTNDSIDNKFTFSTLHSFELPIALKYTYRKLTIMGGANFVYALGINANNQHLPYAVTNMQPGLNTAPTLNINDFGARFGVGYLFGVNYKITPNVSLDLRNVRTFWDNKTVGGAKTVSEQLYKSPSIQFSINYRLGAGKDD